MAGFWNKVTEYLGLSDNESYGDYEPYDEQPAPPGPARRAAAGGGGYETETPPSGTVRTLPAGETGVGGVSVQPRSSSSVRTLPVQATPQTARVHVVAPTSFAEAQEIGERFRSGQPVIINLTGVDRDLQRRMVDFSSGVVFGLNGTMKKVADKVYMLTPSNVEVSADEKRRLQERGLYGS